MHLMVALRRRVREEDTLKPILLILKVKVSWSRYRPGVAQRVGRSIALLFHDRFTRRGWVVSSTPRPHFTPGKDTVPILQEVGWAPGPVWTGGKSRPQWNFLSTHFFILQYTNYNGCMEDLSNVNRLLSVCFGLLCSMCYSRPLEKTPLWWWRHQPVVSLQLWCCGSSIRQLGRSQFLQLMCVGDYRMSK